MPELIVLGSAASVPDAEHDTVALLLRGSGWAVLIDCGGSPLHKLARLGVEADHIRAVVLTHSHADHIYGLPMLVQGLWLGGRDDPLPIHGPQETLDLAYELLKLFELHEREGMFRIQWQPISRRAGVQVLEEEGVRITATPVDHGSKDTRALRFDNTATGRSIVFSADKAPDEDLVELATGADLLIHEASGAYPNHSTPAQAADIANRAGVAELALIHYPVVRVDLEAWRQSAAEFAGPVTLARDGDAYPL